ncbi:transcriptional repressor LexA [Halochromatium glycolicum]|uniref:LexA repressor n=1 Tax=Halochromatium glycolicum TaxID=85075 RepID=A0AAJ0U1X5_9GAMM|nr:transcriptional repressor LexA [Halochromatium glycolicum]MBK1703763.1 repressor LexA [Halochromatium glycolicum]
MSDPLTPRQRQILAFIQQRLRETGYPPTRAEIAKAFGFRSVNAAVDHLKALARQGAIALQPGASRGIKLLQGADEPSLDPGLRLPVVGRVAAGSPILAEEHIEDYHAVDPALFHPRADYLLRVRGSSMHEAGILDGDLLAVHRTPEAHNGQIVVARLDDEVTVKRFRHDEGQPHRVQLLPANPEFAPIHLDLRERALIIEGLGVGVLRLGLDQGEPGTPTVTPRIDAF